MKRIEPPLATWVLEHLSPGDRDEALEGDLLEDFRTGRSDAWYWRQVLAALAVAWYRSFRERAPLLLFAFLWSMLAPAWTVLMDRLQNNARVFGQIWQMDWPFSAPSRFAIWMALNVVFLWAGVLVYCISLTRLSKVRYRSRLRRALAVAPSIFLPLYVATLILMNLFAWPGLEMDRRSITPFGEIIDVGTWANVLRVPYLLTLLGALWNAVPRLPQFSSSPGALKPAENSIDVESIAVARELDAPTCRRFFAFMVGAGLLNAMIAGFVLCRLPDAHSPTLTDLFVRAVLYVLIGALAGAGGAWFYWQSPASPFRTDPPVPFAQFAVVCAAGWVWVPATVILAESVSAAASWVAMTGAYLLAAGLRNTTAPVFAPSGHASWPEETELFAATLFRAPFDASGYAMALGLFAASYALATRSNFTATTLFGGVAFLFAWKRTVPRMSAASSDGEYRRGARRLARVAIPAVLVTAWALLVGVGHRNRAMSGVEASGGAQSNRHSGTANKTEPTLGAGGFESVILWPFPPKKQIIPPVPAPANNMGPEKSRPMVIRFDGAYWYFQPPDKGPGRTAHQARGTPLSIDIQSNNSFPLMMEAHQRLVGPVRLSRCGELDVQIENRDNLPGTVSLAVMLGDSGFPNAPTLYLGEQQIQTSSPGFFSWKAAPVSETLRFAIPAPAPLRKFDDITVMLLSDVEHMTIGPKIAIEQFQIFPR